MLQVMLHGRTVLRNIGHQYLAWFRFFRQLLLDAIGVAVTNTD